MIVEFQNKVEQHLKKIYKNVQLDTRVDILAKDLIDIIGKDRRFYQREISDEFWSEKDCMLISYGDSITTNQERPLQTLNKFIQKKFTNIEYSINMSKCHDNMTLTKCQ